jgi:hypothetical protein
MALRLEVIRGVNPHRTEIAADPTVRMDKTLEQRNHIGNGMRRSGVIFTGMLMELSLGLRGEGSFYRWYQRRS